MVRAGPRMTPIPQDSASAGVSGSRACDAEEGQDSGGVAGVAAQRGGDVAVPVPPEDADGEVAQAGHGSWAVPVRTWLASSAKVVSRM